MSDGLCVVVDRTNYDQEQRAYFLGVASELGARAHVMLFRHSQELCEMRARDRSGHEGGLQGEEAVVRRGVGEGGFGGPLFGL